MAGPKDIHSYPDTEYGGRAEGLVQPDPHVLKPWEVKMMMARSDNPADPASGVEYQDRFESAGG
jgi:hypothetical protein